MSDSFREAHAFIDPSSSIYLIANDGVVALACAQVSLHLKARLLVRIRTTIVRSRRATLLHLLPVALLPHHPQYEPLLLTLKYGLDDMSDWMERTTLASVCDGVHAGPAQVPRMLKQTLPLA